MGADNIYVISEWISFTIAFISFCCTLITLLIIKQMNKWNGYLLLISTMTFFQLLYDINYMLGPVPAYESCVIWNFLDVLGGLGNSFTSNIISLTVIYVVYRVRSFNIIGNFKYIFFICGFIPFVFSILTFAVVRPQREDDDIPFQYCVYTTSPLAFAVSGFYYWGRLSSIIFNFIAFIYVSYKVKKMANMATVDPNAYVDNSMTDQNTQFNAHQWMTEQQLEAVFTLASRMKYYPLAQAICRSGAAWNEFLNYQYSNHASIITAAICAPLSGVFYFLIFLIMQPHARSILYNFLMGKTAISTINMSAHHRNTSRQDQLESSRRFVFRDSLQYVDESQLEEMINSPVNLHPAAQLVSIPMQWTSNPVRESDMMHMRTTGSVALMYQDDERSTSIA